MSRIQSAAVRWQHLIHRDFSEFSGSGSGCAAWRAGTRHSQAIIFPLSGNAGNLQFGFNASRVSNSQFLGHRVTDSIPNFGYECPLARRERCPSCPATEQATRHADDVLGIFLSVLFFFPQFNVEFQLEEKCLYRLLLAFQKFPLARRTHRRMRSGFACVALAR